MQTYSVGIDLGKTAFSSCDTWRSRQGTYEKEVHAEAKSMLKLVRFEVPPNTTAMLV
jgi:hypothetical protein